MGSEGREMFHTVKTRKRQRARSAFVVDPDYRARLGGCDLTRFGRSRDTIYVLDSQLRMRGYNASYARVARRIGGRPWLRSYGLGFPVLEGFTGFYAEHYGRVYRHCLAEGAPYAAVYGCATPESFGWYREAVSQLATGDGLLVRHQLLESIERDEAADYDERAHRNDDGLVLQCCHCERVRDNRRPDAWEWLPDLRAIPDLELSHGLCPHCLDTYYGDLLVDRS